MRRTWMAHLLTILVSTAFVGCTTDDSGVGPGGGSATVEFGDPKQFVDIQVSGPFGAAEQDRKLAELRQFIETEARRQLPPGRHVDVRITNIDLSGTVRPGARTVRVSSSTNPAYVDLEYSLRSGESVIRSGHETLASTAPSSGIPSTSGGGMPLLEDAFRRWLRKLGRINESREP